MYITSDISELSTIVNPRMGSDNISDSDMLRTVVTFLSGTNNNTDGSDQPENSTRKQTSIINELFDKNTLLDAGCRDKKMCKFVKATTNSACGVVSLAF